MYAMPRDLPLLYDKNRRTFMLILSILIGLLYTAALFSNGLRGFAKAWQSCPEQEHYVLIPYSGSSTKLKEETLKIENYLKNSPLIRGFRKIDEQAIQKMFSPQSFASKSWIESIPFPVFIELNVKSASQESVERIESQLTSIVPDAQVYTQPRYSTEFLASFQVLSYIVDAIIACLITVFLAVMILMIRALFAQQEKNIERLSLLGATPAYIRKLYCWFMARCVALSSLYGFLGACVACWSIHLATQQMGFFPYGFSLPSLLMYLLLPYACIIFGVSITYFLVTKLLKKQWSCA